MADKTFTIRGYETNQGHQIAGQAWDQLFGEAVFVEPEVAWQGLNELHRRGLGESAEFRMPGVADMTPLDAVKAYEQASGAILAQLWVDGPSRGEQFVTSINEHLQSGGGLDGLEGVLTSAALTADRDGGGADALLLTAGLLKQGGVSDHLGAGREFAPVLDAAGDRLAGLGKEALEKAAGSTVGREGGNLLRSELNDVLARPPAEGPAGHGHNSGGGPNLGQFLLGALEAGIGAVVAAEVPVLGGALIADGVRRGADGLSQGRPAADTPAATEHAPGVRAVETHYEKVTVSKTNADGSTETVTRESYTTKSVMTDARPRTGGENKCWDEAGGGFDPVTGDPIPVNPCAIVMCQPSDGEFDPTAIVGPHRRDDRSLGEFGPYAALEEIVTAPAGPEGVVDADVLFADWSLTPAGAFEPPFTVTNEPYDPSAFNGGLVLVQSGATRTDGAKEDLETAIITRRGSSRQVAIVKRADTDLTTLLRVPSAEAERPTMTIWMGGRGYITVPL